MKVEVIQIELPENIVEAIKGIIEHDESYDSVEDFIKDVVRKEISKVLTMKKREFIRTINCAQGVLEQIKTMIADENLKQKLDEFYSELGKVVGEFNRVFFLGSSPHPKMVGEER
jgi:deoxyhypusine synthase